MEKMNIELATGEQALVRLRRIERSRSNSLQASKQLSAFGRSNIDVALLMDLLFQAARFSSNTL